MRNFSATVTMSPAEKIELVTTGFRDGERDSIRAFHRNLEIDGYYGGVRLLKASIKRFVDYCDSIGHELIDRNFSMTFESDIPRQVGMAGSSAIVTAALRALGKWFGVAIAPQLLASLTLSAEKELGIPAGLQDRVVQAYEGVVYMDFSRDLMTTEHGLTMGQYQPLKPNLLSNVYVAYSHSASQPTEVLHNNLRQRYDAGEQTVVDAMTEFAAIARDGLDAMQSGDQQKLSRLIDRNFDLRSSICQLHELHRKMVAAARSCGASAKFCGSGGAIVGTYDDEAMYQRLCRGMQELGCETLKPDFADPCSRANGATGKNGSAGTQSSDHDSISSARDK